jgi:hypothetical protein
MSLDGPGKFKRRKQQARHFHERDRAGSAVPPGKPEQQQRSRNKAARQARKAAR